MDQVELKVLNKNHNWTRNQTQVLCYIFMVTLKNELTLLTPPSHIWDFSIHCKISSLLETSFYWKHFFWFTILFNEVLHYYRLHKSPDLLQFSCIDGSFTDETIFLGTTTFYLWPDKILIVVGSFTSIVTTVQASIQLSWRTLVVEEKEIGIALGRGCVAPLGTLWLCLK